MLGFNWTSLDSVRFRVWAPLHSSLHLKLGDRDPIPMHRDDKGYFQVDVTQVHGGELYFYQFSDGTLRPDPASRYQPSGPFAPSALYKSKFQWTDSGWKGVLPQDFIFYECHIGTFSHEGTFLGALAKLPHLKQLGITCLSLMPLAQFSGKYNWGYDWACAYAPHNSYGTPDELKQLINACHEAGIAVCLDVVYNHFGPEGCFLTSFGPYASKAYKTPWGSAINFDGPHSDEVRTFFIQNALYWVEEFHVDAFRLDATHCIFDFSATPFLQQLISSVEKKAFVMAENNLNNSRLVRPLSKEGFGAHAFLNDDFHHALHVALTKEREDYYADYATGLEDLKTVLKAGVIYDGSRYSPSRQYSYGRTFKDIPFHQLIVFLQNHDQVGNRAQGDRISLSLPLQKTVALLILLSPFLPLLFMGQEYGEENPFQYFIDFENRELVAKTWEEKKKTFPNQQIPTIDASAFSRSKLSWEIKQPLFHLYQELIALRKSLRPAVCEQTEVQGTEHSILIEYQDYAVFCAFSKGSFPIPKPYKTLRFHTEQKEFGGAEPPTLENGQISTPCPVGGILNI